MYFMYVQLYGIWALVTVLEFMFFLLSQGLVKQSDLAEQAWCLLSVAVFVPPWRSCDGQRLEMITVWSF